MKADESIITVKEARKFLGKSAKSLSDDDLKEVIKSMSYLADVLMSQFSVPQNRIECYNQSNGKVVEANHGSIS